MIRVVPLTPSKVMTSGVITLGPGASFTVANDKVTANTRFNLTAQDGGNIPKGNIYLLTRNIGSNFVIKSTVNTDTGVRVYWEMIEPVNV
jgi:hypothetical protein